MARVDFYILPDADETRRQHYVCRLADKAWRLGHRVWIHAPTPAHASALDQLLWTFRPDSFLPHERAGNDDGVECPVVIGNLPRPDDNRDLLINESRELPADIERFARIAEVVNQAEETRAAGRTRYAGYRDAGHELHHHRMDR